MAATTAQKKQKPSGKLELKVKDLSLAECRDITRSTIAGVATMKAKVLSTLTASGPNRPRLESSAPIAITAKNGVEIARNGSMRGGSPQSRIVPRIFSSECSR